MQGDENMSNIIQVIKEIVFKTINNMQLPDFLTGTVVSVYPLNIRISSKITLKPIHLYVLRSANGIYQTSEGKSVIHTLKVGDMVALGKFKGGEKYLVLGEVKKL